MLDEINIKSRAELREWLRVNHTIAPTTWLNVYTKKSPHYLAWGEIVSELLCWGWIDSVRRSLDGDRASIRISPRKPKSIWSAINKTKVDELRQAGLMTEAGEAIIAQGKSNGMWEFLDDVDRLECPDDFLGAIGFNQTIWDEWPRSVKHSSLAWIKMAKMDATRQKRIAKICESMVNGERPSLFG